jgi:thymidylate kinase
MTPGKFIVLEGADACGKETQAALLAAHFQKEGYAAKVFTYHRYATWTGHQSAFAQTSCACQQRADRCHKGTGSRYAHRASCGHG